MSDAKKHEKVQKFQTNQPRKAAFLIALMAAAGLAGCAGSGLDAAAGVVSGSLQVPGGRGTIDARGVSAVQPGWTRDQVLAALGPPFEVGAVASFQGDVLSWRYWDPGPLARLFHVYVDPQGIVQRVHSSDVNVRGRGRH